MKRSRVDALVSSHSPPKSILSVWSAELGLSILEQAVLVGGATFLLVEASYRYLERPIVEGRGLPLRLLARRVEARGAAA